MGNPRDTTQSEPVETTFEMLPFELKALFANEIMDVSTILTVRLVDHTFKKIIDSYLFSDISRFLKLLEKLNPADARKLCRLYTLTDQYKRLKIKAKTFDSLTPDEVICYSLTTDNIYSLNGRILKDVIKEKNIEMSNSRVGLRINEEITKLEEEIKKLNNPASVSAENKQVEDESRKVSRIKLIERKVFFLKQTLEFNTKILNPIELLTVLLDPYGVLKEVDLAPAKLPYITLDDSDDKVNVKLVNLDEHLELIGNKDYVPPLKRKYYNLGGGNLIDKFFFRLANRIGSEVIPFDLTGANFSQANLARAVFMLTILNDASFQGVNAIQVEFSGASLINANFKDAILESAKFGPSNNYFAKTFYLDCELGLPVNLTEANFTGANLQKAIFLKAILTGANFTNANLNGAIFESLVLDKVSFVNVDLNTIQFKNVVFKNIILLENDISSSNLSQSLSKVGPMIQAHASSTELRQGLVQEIISKAKNMKPDEGVAFIEAAIAHQLFKPRGGFKKLASNLGFHQMVASDSKAELMKAKDSLAKLAAKSSNRGPQKGL